MRVRRLLAFGPLALALAAGPAAPPAGAVPYRADVPTARVLYQDGPSGRYLLGGTWLFRLDPPGGGLKAGLQRSASTAGWSPVSVPNSWNANDDSDASMRGGVAWYRKDFRLPDTRAALDWVVRFESVNYRSQVWLNGHPIGSNSGAYLPFELPMAALRRDRVNRLVVRVDNRRLPRDFPPSGLTPEGALVGGWWNYGGILREVYLRRIDTLDLADVVVRPVLPCTTCAARVNIEVTARNVSRNPQPVTVRATYGTQAVALGGATLAAGQARRFTGSVRVARPRLWAPGSPSLYRARIEAAVGARTVARYSLMSGIRSIKVVGGRLVLNGRFLNVRGVGLHEDSRGMGFAIDNAVRARFVAETKELGATMIRAHYPLHPYLNELADREGILVWSEIPVYGLKTPMLANRSVRAAAARYLHDNIVANQNHPSIVIWSIANELSSKVGPSQGYYIRRAATTAHQLDPTRPVGLAVAGYPSAGCQAGYAPLDVIGVNDYFGWYPGPNGQIADRSLLSGYLDHVRACYPGKAIMVTEFGAEANREGPVEEKGTYAFQSDFAAYHLGVYGTKPWLSGALYWTLEEFKVRPGWEGGNPRSQPPIHAKGLISYTGMRKPAFAEVQRWFRATPQLGAPVSPRGR